MIKRTDRAFVHLRVICLQVYLKSWVCTSVKEPI